MRPAARGSFEERYITHNVTDILVGSAFAPERVFTHAQHHFAGDQRYTAVFEDIVPSPEASVCCSTTSSSHPA